MGRANKQTRQTSLPPRAENQTKKDKKIERGHKWRASTRAGPSLGRGAYGDWEGGNRSTFVCVCVCVFFYYFVFLFPPFSLCAEGKDGVHASCGAAPSVKKIVNKQFV